MDGDLELHLDVTFFVKRFITQLSTHFIRRLLDFRLHEQQHQRMKHHDQKFIK
jgi:hypothetical protein